MKNIINKSKIVLCILLSILAVVSVTACGEKGNVGKGNSKQDNLLVKIDAVADDFFDENKEVFISAYVEALLENVEPDWRDRACFEYGDSKEGMTAQTILEEIIYDNNWISIDVVKEINAKNGIYEVAFKCLNVDDIVNTHLNGFLINDDNCILDQGIESVVADGETTYKDMMDEDKTDMFTLLEKEEDKEEFLTYIFFINYLYVNGESVETVEYPLPEGTLQLKFKNVGLDWECETKPEEFKKQLSNIFK